MSDVSSHFVISPKSEQRLEIFREADGSIKLTDDQKRAVLENGNILVSASAGAGKSSTLVKRIILKVVEGASLSDMLVLVYNESAAAELKEKLYKALFEQACKQTGDVQERLRKEMDNIVFCNIRTIHSYCNALIRENFEKIVIGGEKVGISPSFEVLDDVSNRVYMNEAMDEVFAQYVEQGDEVFFMLSQPLSEMKSEKNFKNTIFKIYELMSIQPNVKDFDDCIDECYCDYKNSKFSKILMSYYKKYVARARKIFMSFYNLTVLDKGLAKHRQKLDNALSLCDSVSNAHDIDEMLVAFDVYEKVKLTGGAQDDFVKYFGSIIKDYVADFDKTVDEVKELCKYRNELESFHNQNALYVRKLVEIAKKFAVALERNKLKNNVLSFDDLQRYAYDLLENYDIPNNFKAIFVDEYQDVNPLQEAIINKLVKDDCECFFVGDVKQSIYGFRLADPSLFLERLDKYKHSSGNDKNIYFNANFRSAYPILQFVNDIFEHTMTVATADLDYKNEGKFVVPTQTGQNACDDLKNKVKTRDEDERIAESYNKGIAQVHVLVCDKVARRDEVENKLYDIVDDEPFDEIVKGSVNEGRFIAHQIKLLVGRAIGDNGKRIGYGDITILFRSRYGGARSVLKVLKDEGIPLNDSSFLRSDSKPETELLCMLRSIDNPRQDIPFVGYLLSFFGGYNESELADISTSVKGDCFYDKFVGRADFGDELADKIKNTLKTLEEYRIKSGFENVAQLMGDIVRNFSYDAYIIKNGDGDVYSLNAFISSARTMDNSLSKFLQGYDSDADTSVKGVGGDRVVVASFHGYKGLENEIVFVAGIEDRFSSASTKDDVIISGKGIAKLGEDDNSKGLIGLPAYNFETNTKYKNTLSKHAVSKCLKDNQLKEEIRLFYVALTRAKKMLYVTATVSASKGESFAKKARLSDPSCALDLIEDAIYSGNIEEHLLKYESFTEQDKDMVFNDFVARSNMTTWAFVHNPLLDEDETRISLTDDVVEENPKADEELLQAIKQVQGFEYPYKEATKLAMKYSVSALDSIDDENAKIYQEGANIGSAYHKVMQYIDYFADGLDGVCKELDRLIEENCISQEEKDCVRPEDIRRCLDSDIMKYAKECELKGQCHREQPFMMYKPARDVYDGFDSDDKVLVQGVIDLFIDGDTKIIVDFKNSRLADEKMVEKYKKQLYLYKMAVESTFSVKIDKVMLYSFKTGLQIEL